MSTEYATWMADESVRNSLGELQHILDNAAGCIDELSGPKVMITDGPLEDGYVVSGVYSIEHGAKPETGLFFTSTQVENMRRAVTTLTKAALEQALTQQRVEVLDRPARVAGRDFKPGELVRRVVGRAHAEYDRHHGGCLRHPYTGELRDYRDVESDPDGTLCVGPGPLAATTPQPSADAVREVPDGMVAMLRECYEWLFDSKSDGPRVSEGAHLKGYYTPEFLDLHTRLSALLSAASDHQQNAAQGGGD